MKKLAFRLHISNIICMNLLYVIQFVLLNLFLFSSEKISSKFSLVVDIVYVYI